MSLVSIIIPYYNSENTILRALDSVINQSYSNVEIITIDDGSNDGSYEKVEEWEKLNNIILLNVRQKNSGPSAARNRGIELAKGQFVAFLDADDSWDKNKLEKQLKYLENDEALAIIGCDHYVKSGDTIITKSNNSKELKEVTFNKKLIKNQFCTPSVVIRRKVLIENDIRFLEDQRVAEDTLFYLQILRRFKGAKIEESLVTLYKPEISDIGLSSRLWETEKFELRNFSLLYMENDINNKNKISIFKLCFLYLFSLMKFSRRLMKKYLRSK